MINSYIKSLKLGNQTCFGNQLSSFYTRYITAESTKDERKSLEETS